MASIYCSFIIRFCFGGLEAYMQAIIEFVARNNEKIGIHAYPKQMAVIFSRQIGRLEPDFFCLEFHGYSGNTIKHSSSDAGNLLLWG